MQFFHSVIEDLEGLPDEEHTPMGTALEELLGGERGSLIDLADRFTQARLGRIMASWIGDGPNLTISTQELRHVLGEARVEELATLTGMPSERFLQRLIRLLPEAVHRLTPTGEIEEPHPRRVHRHA